MLDDKPRIRISAKQTAKNFWQIDGTVEYNEETFKIENPNDVAEIKEMPLGEKLLEVIKSTEKAFRDDGKKIVGDAE